MTKPSNAVFCLLLLTVYEKELQYFLYCELINNGCGYYLNTKLYLNGLTRLFAPTLMTHVLKLIQCSNHVV